MEGSHQVDQVQTDDDIVVCEGSWPVFETAGDSLLDGHPVPGTNRYHHPASSQDSDQGSKFGACRY
jgi:hypothetical protein